MSSFELAMEEFQFAATLGLVWSIPLVCASWGAFARISLVMRIALSSIPVILVVAWVCFGGWRAREAFYSVEDFVPAVVYFPLYLGALLTYQRLRILRGWMFVSGANLGVPELRFRVRFTIRSFLVAITAISIFAGACALFPRIAIISALLFLNAVLVFVVAGVMPHAIAALVSRRSYLHASIGCVITIVSNLLGSKWVIAESLPGGPGLGFPNDDLFGPNTFGFAISILGVQALYLLTLFELGLRFGARDEQLEVCPPEPLTT